MKLDAVKLGLATAIVTAVVWLVSRGLFLLAMPAHPMWRAGYMMRGGGGPMMLGAHPRLYAFGWVGLVIGLIVWPLVAGLAAAAIAAIYNRLLGAGESAATKSSD